MSRILVGVSGGIAAYKALELIRLATGAGHAVRVVQTPASMRFVGAASFAALTGAPVLTSEFEPDPARGAFPDQPLPSHEPISHLALVENADVFLIAPASANTVAKLAAGLADNLLCSCALAARCPLVVAPAMNDAMYESAPTQANLQTLRARGVVVLDPDSGRLASLGEEGVGRLPPPERLLRACEEALTRRPVPTAPPPAREPSLDPAGGGGHGGAWRGTRVLVTAGGTREPLDSVRYIGNSSSGRMGVALAESARDRGAEVVLIGANLGVEVPPGIRRRDVVTAAELQHACEEEFPGCDVLLMAAAVADFAPIAPSRGKIKKGGRERLELVLEATPDVLAALAATRRDGQTIVGFAAEHGEDAVEQARGKLVGKRLDALVVNDISRPGIGFDAEDNEVTIVIPDGEGGEVDERHVARAPKAVVAEAILDAVERLRTRR